MKKGKIVLLIPILLLGSIFAPAIIHQTHAALTGEICLNDPTAASGSAGPCPAAPAVFNGPRGQQIRVGVFIQASDALNGFDIILVSNHTIIAPVGVDLTGTILPGTPTIILNCMQGLLKTGSVCGSQDNVNTLHFTVTAGLGLLTSPPTTGLLFTAIYNITGTSPVVGTAAAYQTGCTSTSVPGGVCVTIANGSTSPVPETAQAGTFNNSTPPPFVTVTASPSSFGPEFPGTSNVATITATAGTGYPPFGATDAVTFTPIASTGLTATLTGVNPCTTSGLSCSVSLTLSAAAAGNYFVIVSGTYATADALSNPDTLSGTVRLNVVVNDFGFTVSPTTVSFASGSTGTATISLTSLNGFASSITLSTGTIIPTTPPLTITYSPSTVTLAAGATATSTATFSASPTVATTYHTIIKATSGTRIKSSATLTVLVAVTGPDFALTSSPTSLSILAGAKGTSTVTVAPLNGFTGTVNLAASVSPTTGLTTSFSSTSIAGGSGTSTLTISTAPSTATGAYTVTVTGTSGSVSHSITVSVTVFTNQTDFTITANPASLSIAAGTSGTSTISLHGVSVFNSTVFLTVSASNGLTATITPTSTGPFGSATLTVTSNTPGSYTAQVTGTSGSISHTTTVTVTVTSSGVGIVCIVSSSTTSCPATPAILAGTQGTQLRVSVFIQGSNAINGFDITLLADHNILRPSGVNLTGTVLPTPTTILSECVGGVIIHGTSCPANADTIELAAVGALGQLTFPPTTGLLFTAIYNVTGTTSGTAIGYQTGCAPSSVSGTTTCVTVANGSIGPVPETVQTAVLSTSTMPDFVMAASPSTVTINAGASGTSTLSVTSINGFSGSVSLNTTVVTGNLVVSVSPASVTLAAGQTATSTIKVSAPTSTTPGTYQASIAGISGTLFHTFRISVTVNGAPRPDFALAASPSSLSVAQGSSATTAATLTSLNGFTGTVSLTDSSSSAGLTATLSLTSVTLSSGGIATSALTVSTTSTTSTGTYTVTLTGTSGSITHTITVAVTVTTTSSGDFTIAENPTFQAIPVASERQTIITLTSVNGFSGNVNLVITPSTTAFTCWFTTLTDTATVFVPSGGYAYQYPTCGAGRPAGAYTATISGTSGSLTHSIMLGVNVTDYSMTSPVVSFVAGSSITGTVSIASLFGFSGTVTLTTLAPSALSVSCPSAVILSPGGGAAVPCSYSSSSPGTYNATITGTSVCANCYFNGVDTNSLTIVVRVTPSSQPDFTIITNLSFVSVPSGANATFLITLTSLNGFSGNVNLTATVFTSSFNPPIPHLIPSSVFLSSGGSQGSILLLTTSPATPGQTYTISLVATAKAGSTFISHQSQLQLQIVRPPDIPPVANFSVTPTNPVAGQNVAFDGSASFDPDGTVVFWSWSFGDNDFSGGTFTNHNYNRPGNYTVTLTVTDNAGLSSTRSTTVNVRPQPAHDVAIVEVDVRPTTAVETQTVFINIQLLNNGLNNETVSLTAYANGRPVQTLRGLFLPACVPSPFNFCGFRDFFTIAWDTSGVTPGNYTISVTVFLAPGEVDPTPADNSMNGGTVTILPAPVITLSPTTGPDGTKVQVQGTGFLILEQFGYIPVNFVYVNFDNMSTGFTIAHNGTFTFTFDVPLSQAGTHGVFAFDPFSGAHASATFTVQPTSNNNLALSIDMGTIYFPGDTATAYILTTVNGAPIEQGVQLQVTLFKPDGTNTTLTAIRVGQGLYKATYTIPSTGPLGTYLVLTKAHQPGPMDASSLVSFEVKLTWLGSNSGRITVGATTLAGLVGLVGLAWKKGYLRRKSSNETQLGDIF